MYIYMYMHIQYMCMYMYNIILTENLDYCIGRTKDGTLIS